MSGRLAAAVLVAIAVLLTGRASGVPVEVDPPVTVALTIVAEPRNERVTGDLVVYDEAGLTIVVRGERQRFTWSELTPTSSFTARHRLVDPDDPQEWIDLARFGRLVGAERQSEYAIRKALSLDAVLEAEAEAIREMPLGELRRPGLATQGRTKIEPEADPVPAAVDPDLPPRFAAVDPLVGEQAEREAVTRGDTELAQVGVRMRIVKTPHFLIFTDWDPVDDAWLARQLEGAFQMLCREFHVTQDQDVFVGRLPVYMFNTHAGMLRYAIEIDGFETDQVGVAGYYASNNRGIGKLVMSKPRATDAIGLDLARRAWARTLTHEFVHAFLARYRGNRFLPRWLNEGLAEMLAETIHPRPGALRTARRVAAEGESIAFIFDDANMPGAEMYPVMMTLTNALYREDPAKFVSMVDRIKAGEETEALLKELYDVDYPGLERAWRAYMLRN
jgi:hypothetical protein